MDKEAKVMLFFYYQQIYLCKNIKLMFFCKLINGCIFPLRALNFFAIADAKVQQYLFCAITSVQKFLRIILCMIHSPPACDDGRHKVEGMGS